MRIFNWLTKNESVAYLILVLSIYFAVSFFLIGYYPVFVDEALTFNLFVDQPFSTTISDYPFPNNHVFYSLVANLFSYLPFDQLLKLRLPNLFIGTLTSALVYRYFKAKFDHHSAVIPHIIFTFSYCFIFYSVFARGYLLIISINILCFLVVERLRLDFKSKYLVWFSILTCIGFFTVPIFLYCAVVHGILLIISHINYKSRMLAIFTTYLFTFIGIVICYLPIFVNQGITAISSNDFTKSLSYADILLYFKTFQFVATYDKITGVSSLWIVIILLFMLGLLFRNSKYRGERFAMSFIFLSLCSPFVYMLLQRVIPPGRTWIYLIFPISLGCAYIINYVLIKKSIHFVINYFLAIAIMATQLLILYKANPKAAQEADLKMLEISNYMLEHKVSSAFMDVEYETSGEQQEILFEYKRRNKSIVFYTKNNPPKDLRDVDCLFIMEGSTYNLENFKRVNHIHYFTVYVSSP